MKSSKLADRSIGILAVRIVLRAIVLPVITLPVITLAVVMMTVVALPGCTERKPMPEPPVAIPDADPQQQAPPADASSPPTIDLPADLDRVLRDYESGWRSRDADALAALFSPDGFILRPGHLPVRGRAQIAEAYRNSGGPLYLHAFAYAVDDSIGYIVGGFRSAPDRVDSGKYILLLRRIDGRWYIAADMDNGNQ